MGFAVGFNYVSWVYSGRWLNWICLLLTWEISLFRRAFRIDGWTVLLLLLWGGDLIWFVWPFDDLTGWIRSIGYRWLLMNRRHRFDCFLFHIHRYSVHVLSEKKEEEERKTRFRCQRIIYSQSENHVIEKEGTVLKCARVKCAPDSSRYVKHRERVRLAGHLLDNEIGTKLNNGAIVEVGDWLRKPLTNIKMGIKRNGGVVLEGGGDKISGMCDTVPVASCSMSGCFPFVYLLKDLRCVLI